MGRESPVAFMPTIFISGGSLAPMENSPPGIHAMPAGAAPGAAVEFRTVGPKTGRGSVEALTLGNGAGLRGEIHRLVAELHDSSDATSERDSPDVFVGAFPIGGEDRLHGEVPTLLHVVVDEVLEQKLIDGRTIASAGN